MYLYVPMFLLVTHAHNENDDRRTDTGQRNCAYGVVNILDRNFYSYVIVVYYIYDSVI